MDKRSIKLRAYLLPVLCAAALLLTTSTLSCPLEGEQNKEEKTVTYLNEPGLIDVHAHIGEFKGYDLSLNNLLTNKAETTINEETARVAAAHPQLKPLAWAKPGADKASAANIEPFLRDKKFYG